MPPTIDMSGCDCCGGNCCGYAGDLPEVDITVTAAGQNNFGGTQTGPAHGVSCWSVGGYSMNTAAGLVCSFLVTVCCVDGTWTCTIDEQGFGAQTIPLLSADCDPLHLVFQGDLDMNVAVGCGAADPPIAPGATLNVTVTVDLA